MQSIQLHDYEMASVQTRLATKSKQTHVILNSNNIIEPYFNNFFKAFKLIRNQTRLSMQAHVMAYTQ